MCARRAQNCLSAHENGDATRPHRVRTFRRVIRIVTLAGALALCALAALPALAIAGDDPRFHRTTPRGSFGRDAETLLVGVPGGRAWGIESELRPLPAMPSDLEA